MLPTAPKWLDVPACIGNRGSAFEDCFLDVKAPMICSPALPMVVLAPRKLLVAEDLSGISFEFPMIDVLVLECKPLTRESVVFAPGIPFDIEAEFWAIKTGFEFT